MLAVAIIFNKASGRPFSPSDQEYCLKLAEIAGENLTESLAECLCAGVSLQSMNHRGQLTEERDVACAQIAALEERMSKMVSKASSRASSRAASRGTMGFGL